MRLTSLLADNETDPAAAAPAGPLSPDYVPPEPAAVEPGDEPVEFRVDEDRWNELQGAVADMSAFVQRFTQPVQPQQYAGSQAPDPFADDFQQQLDAYIDSRLAPVVQTTAQWQNNQGEELAQDILADLASKDGEFDQAKARALADTYFPEAIAEHGNTRKAAEEALTRAAADVREWEERVGKAYHERQMNQFRQLGGAPAHIPPAAAAAQRPVPATWSPQHRVDELSLVREYGGRA